MFLSDQEQELRRGAEAFGVNLDENQLRKFGRYFSILYEQNAAIDLTAVPEHRAVSLHFVDSLSVAAVLPMSRIGSLLDVGSGAGFPGIPLKIAYPGMKVTLLESSEKRIKFLLAAIRELTFEGIDVVRERAESAGHDPAHRERYDLVTARAVAHLTPLAEMLLPFVRTNGAAVAYKSAYAADEIEDSGAVIRDLGGGIEHIHSLTLPGEDLPRSLVVMRKCGSTPAKFPRSSQYLARTAKKMARREA